MSELTDMIRIHVMNDLRPYVCTFLGCVRARQTYASRSAFSCHELRYHEERSSWVERKRSLRKPCVFCEEVLSSYTLENRSRHVARHMEEIAFTVVTKPYEDWDFYSDASSVKDQGTDNPRNTTASYDAKGDEDPTYQIRRTQRVSCALCREEKTFSRAEAWRTYMRVVHLNPGGANHA